MGGARLRLLYLMHTDWNWIRQRPQALADEWNALTGLEVRVAYLPNWRRRRLTENPSQVRRSPILQLPFARLPAIRSLNGLLGRAQLRLLIRTWHPDAIVLTDPWLYDYLPRHVSVKLFYDCMDLVVGFQVNPAQRRRAASLESRLLERVAGVFVSSSYLAAVISPRVEPGVPVTLVRNGVDSSFKALPPSSPDPSGILRLGYFGTVARWFDWALMARALALDPRLELHLWGPVTDPVPDLDRVFLHGPVAHGLIPSVVRGMDALVLPFLVNDLIRGVDPVKLYEYVALGLPAISVYYPELEQFRGLVNFYSDEESFLGLVRALRVDPGPMCPSEGLAQGFLAGATWQARARSMADAISSSLRPQENP